MTCPQVVDGGEGLQIWRVARKILNRESWRANKRKSSSFAVGQDANSSSSQNFNMLQNILKSSTLGLL